MAKFGETIEPEGGGDPEIHRQIDKVQARLYLARKDMFDEFGVIVRKGE